MTFIICEGRPRTIQIRQSQAGSECWNSLDCFRLRGLDLCAWLKRYHPRWLGAMGSDRFRRTTELGNEGKHTV